MLFKGNDKGNVKVSVDFSNFNVTVNKSEVKNASQEIVNIDGKMDIDITGNIKFFDVIDMKESAAKLIIGAIKDIFAKK